MFCIRVKIGKIKPCYIIGVYRPPSGNMCKFMDTLSLVLKDLSLVKTELFVLGDFNIDYKSPNLCRKLKIKNFETKFNIKQLINKYTRITNTTSTLLDWIYTSADYVSNCGVVNYNISDHLPTFVIRKKPRNKISKITIRGRSYLRYEKEVFQRSLEGSSWELFDASDDPEIMWDIMEKNIIDILDNICPIKDLVVPESKPDWLNDDIIQLMRKRDKIYKEARKKNDPVTWRKAIFLRNRVEMLIKNSKRDKIQREFQANRNNPKKIWESINSIISDKKGGNIEGLRDDTGTLIQGSFDLAEMLNTFFVNIGKTLAQDIVSRNPNDRNILFAYGPANNNNDNICNIPILEDDITRILKTIDVNKSSAIPYKRAIVIIHAFQNQIRRIVKMYNGSLTLCTFPKKWKKAMVVPLPKVTNPKTVSDLRPVSLLPLPGKILEIIISKRLKYFLEENKILCDRQHGFRKKRSTLSAIVEFLHDVYNNLNENKDTYIVYLDLKKAFDTVSHKILLNKLKLIGIDQITVNWFGSYLENRQQKTVIQNVCSSELNISFGVPQGSILGPTLFTLYINDLTTYVESKINLYADDTVIYGPDPTIIQSDLGKIFSWCNANLLTINCAKSQWMRTNIVNKNAINPTFKMGDIALAKVSEYRYLGMLVDSGLSFQAHREGVINRVNLKINYFRKIRTYLTQDAALLIYKCTILPILEYVDFVYDLDIKYINKKLQTIQNTGLYITYNQHYLPYDTKESTEVLHRRAGISRLAHRRRLHMLSFIYNYIDDIRYVDVRDINTRRREGVLFVIQRCEHYKVRQDPLVRAMETWNSLPVHMRNAETKSELKMYVLSSIHNPYQKID